MSVPQSRAAMDHARRFPSLQRAALPWVLLLAAIALAAGLGLRDPSPPDEPRFALAARHMVESGDWLVPRRGREFYAEKPPVFMWLQAAGYTIVRDWRVAFLLPSLLAALATLWLTADIATRLWGRRFAPHAAAALFVCLQFGLQAKRGQIDMVLVALTTLSLWGLLRHLLRGPDWRAAYLGAFAAGVGTVTKGVGFLPVLVLLPWLFVRRDLARARAHVGDTGNAWRWGMVALAFAAGTAVWLGPLAVALLQHGDPALRSYAAELLLRQTGERYANAWHHVQPPWYFLQVIATLWLPGALLLPWLLPAWWRRLRRRDARYVLLLGWALLVLLFFSASPGKREVYILPMLPALCAAAAPLLPALLRRRGVRGTLLSYLLALAGVATLLAVSGLLGASDWAQRLADQRGLAARTIDVVLYWLLALGTVGLVLAATLRARRSAMAVALFTAALWLVYGLGLMPAIDASSSARDLMRAVGRRIGPGAELGMIAWREQNLLQADRAVVDFGFKQPLHAQWREAAAWAAQAPRQRWLFVLDEALSPCVDRGTSVAIGRSNRRDWWLVPGTALARDCVTPAFDGEQPAE
jgi:4-amino-4-deoxy-L-arabinose transferase-like glycosyltransferase